MRAVRALRYGAAIVLLALISVPAGAAVRAYLSGSDIAPGDTVQLTLQRDGTGGGEPDLSPLRADFDVLGTSRSTRIQIINGSTSASTNVQLTLSPRHAGHLTVPSITWGNEHSPALTLDVTATAGSGGGAAGATGTGTGTGGAAGAAGATAGNARDFIQTEIDSGHPYVQAAVQVTVRLYVSQTLYHPDLEFPASGNVLVQQVGADEQSSTERNGRTYRVLTRHYLLFPQRSGTLTLAGPVLDAQVAAGQNGTNSFGGDPFAQLFGGAPFGTIMTRPIRLHGDAIVLKVRARPASATEPYWLPATQVTLTSQWSPAPLQAHAGEPVTVKLHLQAQGLTAAQLPDLSTLWALPAGLKTYPDQAKLHDAAQGDTVVGSRDQTIALIADQPGRFMIPALTIQWWDTATNRPQEATVPARTLEILPVAGAPTNAAAAPTTPTVAASPATSVPMPPTSARGPTATPTLAAALPTHAHAAGAAPASAAGVTGEHHSSPQSSLWPWIAAALTALWLLTIGAWLWTSKRRGGNDARAARRTAANAPGAHAAAGAHATSVQPSLAASSAFWQACRSGDALTARRRLLAWAAARWPATPPTGLNALSRLLNDPATAALLRELDRACYAGGPWRGEALASRFEKLRPARAEAAGKRGADLAPLYP